MPAAQGPNGWKNCNLRPTFKKIILRAGMEPWPRLFHDLRASCESDLAREYPIATVCKWIGKTVVWFEPEHVHPDTWLHDKRPNWLLSGKNLNLGNPEAQKWLTDHVAKMITSEGIGLYRQDFNMDPLAGWKKNDTPDRQGITENKYVVGLLAYWDELIERYPDLLIDECASGGRRNDLECMKRAVLL